MLDFYSTVSSWMISFQTKVTIIFTLAQSVCKLSTKSCPVHVPWRLLTVLLFGLKASFSLAEIKSKAEHSLVWAWGRDYHASMPMGVVCWVWLTVVFMHVEGWRI